MALSAGTYRGRLGDRLYTTEMPRAGEVVGLGATGLGIADPSAENCVAKGGKYTTKKILGGHTGGGEPWYNEMGVCSFPDGGACEAWAFYRGECSPKIGAGWAPPKVREFLDQPVVRTVRWVGGVAGTMLGAYHGSKRNGGKVWPAVGWALMGGWFWPVAVPVMFAQGLGKPKGR